MTSLYVKHSVGAVSLSSVLVEKRISLLGFLINSPSFEEPENVLSHSQVPASGLDAEPLDSASYRRTGKTTFQTFILILLPHYTYISTR
jgi:hypothetical protein